MKFAKLTLVAMLLALMACAFVACGGDAPVETEDEVVPTETEAAPATEPDPETEEDGSCRHVVAEEIDEPTCEARGYKREYCSRCGEQLSISPIEPGDHIEAAPATCTEGSVCKFCGVAMVGPTGHLIGEVTDFKAATATEAGYQTGICITCDQEITNVLPAGLSEDFSSYREGVLTAGDMNDSENFPGFTVQFGENAKPESYQIVSDNGSKYLSRAGDSSATITLVDTTGKLDSGKFAVSFDYRMDSTASSTGVLSFKDNNGTEHRMISAWVGDVLRMDADYGPNLITDIKPENNMWYNIRVVVDPSTNDYEYYVNGTKVIYSVYDESVSGKHVVWTLTDGEWVSMEAGKMAYHGKTCFGNAETGVASIYMFHYGKVACSIDNLKIEFLSE